MALPPAARLPIAFGPVRSRRLGWSLGINNVWPKSCTYSCVYCQVGATDLASTRRRRFHDPGDIVAAVSRRAEECRQVTQSIDYATFVPDGEPTLDLGVGAAIRGIRAAGLQVAVITNGSLLWDDEVRAAIAPADVVSVKVDTVDETTWHRLNRPLGSLALPVVLDGIRRFAAAYRGDLLTETMLVAGINDDEPSIARTAAFVGALEPLRAYVAVPTRPPAEPWVRAPAGPAALRAAGIFRAAELPTTCLAEDLEDPFAPGIDAGVDAAEGLLGIVAVHPMTEEDARTYLERSGADWAVAQRLLDDGSIVRVPFEGRTYLRAAIRR
jgi:wyosine [tRNA(Phe)-imidazoG37] synthetase (radical SAM superfamily)